MKYSFTVPANWDKPSSKNAARCEKFGKALFRGEGIEIPYRYFRPAITHDAEASLPLVLFLHGADTIGQDNEAHIALHDVATMFADPVWQEAHPCFIVAPQYHMGSYWTVPEMAEGVHHLVKDFAKFSSAIDKKRIYAYGFSAGGVGVFEQLKLFPELYAGGVAICGASSARKLEVLRKTPLWMLHAEDDSIVKTVYGNLDNAYAMRLGSREIYERLKDLPGEDFRYTEYPKGYMEKEYHVHPHCSWVCFSDKQKPEVREWLFSK
ncbi:MAG: hypothetical protein IJU50_05720 [Lachnospiraceae bacterium]|nr:hypothetical protein [Lachnospiraceae bacterium]